MKNSPGRLMESMEKYPSPRGFPILFQPYRFINVMTNDFIYLLHFFYIIIVITCFGRDRGRSHGIGYKYHSFKVSSICYYMVLTDKFSLIIYNHI